LVIWYSLLNVARPDRIEAAPAQALGFELHLPDAYVNGIWHTKFKRPNCRITPSGAREQVVWIENQGG
jgi:hypothetical protein